MLYIAVPKTTHMATVGVKGLSPKTRVYADSVIISECYTNGVAAT